MVGVVTDIEKVIERWRASFIKLASNEEASRPKKLDFFTLDALACEIDIYHFNSKVKSFMVEFKVFLYFH